MATETKNNGRFYKDDATGMVHREDGPAVEWGDGTKIWYVGGKRSRVGGGPAMEFADGTKVWMTNDEYHREDGPAIEWGTGQKEFYVGGKKMSKAAFEARTNPTKK